MCVRACVCVRAYVHACMHVHIDCMHSICSSHLCFNEVDSGNS